MVESDTFNKHELTSKLVQEIIKKGDEIPEEYLYKDGFPEAIDAPELWRDNLLIDFSLLSSSTTELTKLRLALSQWGCFLMINHNMESSFLEEVIEVSKQFFALPLEEKIKSSTKAEIFEGYGNYVVFGEVKTKTNWNDRLFLTIYPEEDRRLKLWPQNPDKFRGMMEEYSSKMVTIHEALYKAMARSLNIEESCFLKAQGEKGNILAKLSFYPRCSNPSHVLGFRPHSDGTTLSIILPEIGVEGLQIEKDDVWYNVPVIPGALFVNVGDLGEVMSNGIFKSVMHRVVTSSFKDRLSMAAFCHPDVGKEIEPLTELVGPDQPPLYRKFDIPEHRQKFSECYILGLSSLQRPIDAFMV